MVQRFDTLIYGRNSWHQMAEFWPETQEKPELPPATRRLSDFMNSRRKIVFSRSMSDCARWAGSVLAKGSVAEVLAEEKKATGQDIVVFAGASLAQSALRTGLVDEIWLMTLPRLFGYGTRLFDGNALARELTLLECKAMDTGAVLTRYGLS
jgi:dihydrofolate reductase